MSKTGAAYLALQEIEDAEFMAAWPVAAPISGQPDTVVTELLPF